MSRLNFAAALLLVFVVTGCETQPPPGAPRAPLPSEIVAPSTPPAASQFKPKSIGEAKKEYAAKKAKEEAEAAKTATEGTATKPAAAAP